MTSQNNTFKISEEQSNLISKKLKEIPFDVQLEGEYLPITSSDKINILILNSEPEVETQTEDKPVTPTKSSQTKNTVKKSQKNSTTKKSSQTNSSKAKSSSQKASTKTTSQNKKSGAQQNQEAQDSKELNDWLDNLLS